MRVIDDDQALPEHVPTNFAASPLTKKGRNKKGKDKTSAKTQSRWWTALSDVDPISLEPLAELAYPPFWLPVRTPSSGKHADGNAIPSKKHFFDGQVLAFYCISTGFHKYK